MDINDYPSPNYSPRKAGTRVDTVLIHHTATVEDQRALRWLCYPGSGVSAHYVVGVRGAVYRLVDERHKAWHAGAGRLPWEAVAPYDFNHRSIGVEVVNPGDGVTPFTKEQYRALEWLVPDVARRLGGVASVVAGWAALGMHPAATGIEREGRAGVCWALGHRDVAPGRKTDPADNFDWSRIRQALERGVA